MRAASADGGFAHAVQTPVKIQIGLHAQIQIERGLLEHYAHLCQGLWQMLADTDAVKVNIALIWRK